MPLLLAVLALMSGQRPGSSQISQPRSLTLSGRLVSRDVRTDALWAQDAEFAASVLDRADTPEGRAFAARVLPPALLERRIEALSLYRDHLRAGRALKAGDLSIPDKIGDLLGGSTETRSIDLGTVVQHDTDPAYALETVYRTVTKTGTLTIKAKPDSPVRMVGLSLYEGDKDVRHYGTAELTPGSKLPVKAGQSLYAYVGVSTLEPGDFKGRLSIVTDSTLQLDVRAKVVPANGQIACWLDSGWIGATQGESLSRTLHVKVAKGAPTKIHVDAILKDGLQSEPIDVRLSSSSLDVSSSAEIGFTVTPGPMRDKKGTLAFRVTGYGGEKTAVVETQVEVVSKWTSYRFDKYLPQYDAAYFPAVIDVKLSTGGEWYLYATMSNTFENPTAFNKVVGFRLKPYAGTAAPYGAVVGAPLAGLTTRSVSGVGFDKRLLDKKVRTLDFDFISTVQNPEPLSDSLAAVAKMYGLQLLNTDGATMGSPTKYVAP